MNIRKLCNCSRLISIVGLAIALMLAVGATAWGQTPNCCQNPCQFPPAGQYTFSTIGHIEALFGPPPGQLVRLDLLGPTMVRASSPAPTPTGNVIQTEMLALELTGFNPLVGQVQLHTIPGTNSMGQTMGQAPGSNPCDLPAPLSFFDVFTELSLDQAPWLGGQPDVVYVGQPGNLYIPVRVTNPAPDGSDSIRCIPPQPGARWCTPPSFVVPLTSRRLNAIVGQLTLVWHTVLEPNHYKTWKITDFSPPQFRTVIAKDQFMTDNLFLDSAVYLSNPAQKCVAGRCFNIADTTDHFTWYKARGRDTLLDVEFTNQFQQTTLRIDSVKYFLLPTRKFPHNPPKLLDHYKAYKIRNPQPFTTQVQLRDQFDLTPEVINTLIPRYFLTPAQKTFGPVPDPVYDTLTHFVAYEINPKRLVTMNRDIEDQFGIHPVRIDSSVFLLVPTCKLRATPPPQDEPCCFTGPAGSLLCALVPAGQCESVYGGTVVPACLGDGNGNGVDDACDGPPTTGPNHFKTWRVLQQDPIVSRSVLVQDQLMQDLIVLDSIQYLSNPTRKTVFNPTGNVTFNVLDTTDHLSWYRATGRDTLLGIEFQNQFGRDTVNIDRVKYLLVPTRKFPHNKPDRLDHYKAYRVRSAETLRRPIELEDQFDLQSPQGPERIDSLVERFFLTPAQKQIPGQQPEPVYDTVTHYVAYQIYPRRRMPQIRDIEDQFGVHVIQVDSSELLLVPTRKLKVIFPPPPEEACCYTSPLGTPICGPVPAGECGPVYGGTVVAACLGDGNGNGVDDACEQPQPDTGRNHYKTWRVVQIDPLVFRTVFVRDQFLKFIKDSTVRLDSIQYLSNPTRKITFDPTGSDTFNVVDTTDHLSWYRASGKSLLKGLQVVFQNQFQRDTIRLDSVRYLLLPTRKFPHQKPDSLDHYKAYRIKKPRAFARPIELQDQFDLIDPRGPELINSLKPRYFLTPARKQIPGQQPDPVYDTVTHYVAYEINPKRPITLIRDLEDQFGAHVVLVDSSELLLVPTQKLFVSRKFKGDLNGSGDLSPADVVLELNCAFLGTGDCELSFSDANCDGTLSPADVVLELNAVFLAADFPC